MNTKTCKLCGKTLPLISFRQYWTDGKRYTRSNCNHCERAEARMSYDPEKRKNKYININDRFKLPKDPMSGTSSGLTRSAFAVKRAREEDARLMEEWYDDGCTSGREVLR